MQTPQCGNGTRCSPCPRVSCSCCSLVVTAAVSYLVADVDQFSKAHILRVWIPAQWPAKRLARGSNIWCQEAQVIRQMLQQPSNLCVSLHSGLWETSQSARDERVESVYLLDRLSKPSTGISLCRYSFQCVARLLLIFILEVGGARCRFELTVLVCEPQSIWSQSLVSITFQHTGIHCERILQQSSIKSAI